MTVSNDLAELQKMVAAGTDVDTTGLATLTSVPAVVAYVAASAKADHRDPSDDCETLVRHAQLSPGEVRAIAASLRRLGFKAPAERLFTIAGRRRRDLKPLR